MKDVSPEKEWVTPPYISRFVVILACEFSNDDVATTQPGISSNDCRTVVPIEGEGKTKLDQCRNKNFFG
jgi:hypothetical protein